VLVALLATLAALHHGQAAARCSPAAAEQAARSSGIGLAQPPDRLICLDFTRDGRIDMAVTLLSGGYKLGLDRVGDLVQTQPVYREDDPNCCPTGGFDHTRWHWNGARFIAARTWRDRPFRP
jgi:hypothetical protein